MSGIQRPLTTEEQLNLGLITEHDTPGSPHREHMGGSKQPPRLPEDGGDRSFWTGKNAPKAMRAEAKELLRSGAVPRLYADQFKQDFERTEGVADRGNPGEMQAVLEAWKTDPAAASKNKKLRGVEPSASGREDTPRTFAGVPAERPDDNDDEVGPDEKPDPVSQRAVARWHQGSEPPWQEPTQRVPKRR